MTAEKLVHYLVRQGHQAETDGGLVTPVVVSGLVRRAEDIATSLDPETVEQGLADFVNALAAAALALNWILRACEHTTVHLINPENLTLHLQFPYNIFTGQLLEARTYPDGGEIQQMAFVREHMLRALRKEVERATDLGNNLKAQHALHLLVRHGTENDRDTFSRLLRSDEVEVKRMLHCGLAARLGDTPSKQWLIGELRKSKPLQDASVAFDAIHYGDVALRSNELPACGEVMAFSRSFANALRRLNAATQAEDNAGQELALFYVGMLLAVGGNRIPVGAETTPRLERALARMEHSAHPNTRNLEAMRKLVRTHHRH